MHPNFRYEAKMFFFGKTLYRNSARHFKEERGEAARSSKPDLCFCSVMSLLRIGSKNAAAAGTARRSC